MQPYAPGAHQPCFLDGACEHHPAESTTDEFRDETEVLDLHGVIVVAAQLEVAGGLAADCKLPDRDVG